MPTQTAMPQTLGCKHFDAARVLAGISTFGFGAVVEGDDAMVACNSTAAAE